MHTLDEFFIHVWVPVYIFRENSVEYIEDIVNDTQVLKHIGKTHLMYVGIIYCAFGWYNEWNGKLK
jgi:hypothetical protein